MLCCGTVCKNIHGSHEANPGSPQLCWLSIPNQHRCVMSWERNMLGQAWTCLEPWTSMLSDRGASGEWVWGGWVTRWRWGCLKMCERPRMMGVCPEMRTRMAHLVVSWHPKLQELQVGNQPFFVSVGMRVWMNRMSARKDNHPGSCPPCKQLRLNIEYWMIVWCARHSASAVRGVLGGLKVAKGLEGGVQSKPRQGDGVRDKQGGWGRWGL